MVPTENSPLVKFLRMTAENSDPILTNPTHHQFHQASLFWASFRLYPLPSRTECVISRIYLMHSTHIEIHFPKCQIHCPKYKIHHSKYEKHQSKYKLFHWSMQRCEVLYSPGELQAAVCFSECSVLFNCISPLYFWTGKVLQMNTKQKILWMQSFLQVYFSKCISPLYFSTVFLQCISPLYFSTVFLNSRAVQLNAKEKVHSMQCGRGFVS